MHSYSVLVFQRETRSIATESGAIQEQHYVRKDRLKCLNRGNATAIANAINTASKQNPREMEAHLQISIPLQSVGLIHVDEMDLRDIMDDLTKVARDLSITVSK